MVAVICAVKQQSSNGRVSTCINGQYSTSRQSEYSTVNTIDSTEVRSCIGMSNWRFSEVMRGHGLGRVWIV